MFLTPEEQICFKFRVGEVYGEERFIRTEVFINEQGFKNEFDEKDPGALHLVLFADGGPAACGRLLRGPDEKIFIIGRVAVLKKYRGRGLGSTVVQVLEDRAKKLGGESTGLSAQCRVQKFYEKLGYEAQGEKYFDEYCQHIYMQKRLL
ncbi:MAG TPA: GNAT family N-acetyltransferase [Ruminococcaceae bacterium]|nr:GNAT family N-acetyltransferase [Oscillospiraceae bacterium]